MELETINASSKSTNSPLISVIVPIYNMEKLMRKCLDSILAQTFPDYECLLIDDGSKDGSPAICDEYAAKDRRFKAFHKPNGGLSDARNYGLARAQGEYTIFFDPDDWVDEDCLKDLYEKAKETNADIVMCDFYNENQFYITVKKLSLNSLDRESVLKGVLTGRIIGATWNKLIKRDLYLTTQILYPVGIYGCEDQYTMCRLLKNEVTIAYIPKPYYHYMYYGNGTQSRHYNENTYEMDKKIVNMFVSLFSDEGYRQLAYLRKTSYMVGHAFLCGQKYFTNDEFVESFGEYEQLIKKVSRKRIINVLYWFSFRGYYQYSIRLFNCLMAVNTLFKKIGLKR